MAAFRPAWRVALHSDRCVALAVNSHAEGSRAYESIAKKMAGLCSVKIFHFII